MSREKLWLCVFLAIAMMIFGYFKSVDDQEKLNEAVKPIKQKIAAANRPKIISFSAPWCGACQQFKPEIQKAMANYGQSVDCDILNVDNSANRDTVKAFRVSAIPATFIFDRKGNIIFKHVGYMDAQELDQQLRKTIF